MQIIRAKELTKRLGISRMSLWRWSQAGKFPAAIRLGPRTTGWDKSEVDEWLESRKNAPETAAERELVPK